MSASISPKNEQFLDQVVASGLFADRAEALDEAVRLLRRREELRREIDAGVDQLDNGCYVEYGEDELQRFLGDVRSKSGVSPKNE